MMPGVNLTPLAAKCYGFDAFPDDPDTLVLRISDIGPYPMSDPHD